MYCRSLTDPALDRILDFAAETGLLVILHDDIDVSFAKVGAEPVYLTRMKALLKRHPKTNVIWAHVGLGRVVHPVQQAAAVGAARRPQNHMELVIAMLEDPELWHLYFDISWDEVARYLIASPEATRGTAAVINRFPDRTLFGTDEVAPPDQARYLRIYDRYEPVWKLLTPEAREKVLKGNYERLFDAARKKVRAWEAANVPREGR
jgi:predicted TIM-barrel fold metal-dependent hydrolase